MPELHHVLVWDGKTERGLCDVIWHDETISEVRKTTRVFSSFSFVLIPGLIDTHVHLASYAGIDSVDYRTWPLITHPTERVLHAYVNARKALTAGITTLRDMEAGWCQISLREIIGQGLLPGPRVLAYGMVGMTGGHADLFTPSAVEPRLQPVADGVDACRKQVRTFARMGMDGIKIATGGGVLSMGDRPTWRNYTDAENAAIVDEAHSLGLPVAAHAHDAKAIDAALRARVNSIEHATLLTECQAQEIVQRGLSVAPTILINNRIATETVPVRPEIVQKARELVT
ncbi:MAG: hypothetical protein C7B44_06140 [Sulfobacillus thermosulfidooxidans]|nr:MAG: hypothetical protein C7B44_06140 [Sulfobacillus thermosulfidooxidans]